MKKCLLKAHCIYINKCNSTYIYIYIHITWHSNTVIDRPHIIYFGFSISNASRISNSQSHGR